MGLLRDDSLGGEVPGHAKMASNASQGIEQKIV